MEKDTTTNFETIFKDDLYQYLLSHNEVDERLPEAPDLDELWQKIAEAYIPDAIREFPNYPTVALGWIMYVGMATIQQGRKPVCLPARPNRFRPYRRLYSRKGSAAQCRRSQRLGTPCGRMCRTNLQPVAPFKHRTKHQRGLPCICRSTPSALQFRCSHRVETVRLPYDSYVIKEPKLQSYWLKYAAS